MSILRLLVGDFGGCESTFIILAPASKWSNVLSTIWMPGQQISLYFQNSAKCQTVIPDLIRYPVAEESEKTGFRVKPGMTN